MPVLHSLRTITLFLCGICGPSAGTGALHAQQAPAPSASPAPLVAKAPFNAQQARAHQSAWAAHWHTQVETANSIGMRLTLIPPGEFQMGSSDQAIEAALATAQQLNVGLPDRRRISQAERPQHRVVISRPYWMGTTEVTIGQFRQLVADTQYVTETERLGGGNSHRQNAPADNVYDPAITWAAPGYEVTDDSPVAQVTWNDAVAFCDWLSKKEQASYRLPTEAQWEFAARTGTTTQYSFGDDVADLEKYGWIGKNSAGRPRAVGTKSANAFGLFDMHGNVREWCRDWYHATWYEQSPTEDPLGPEQGTGRVLRGGNWFNKATYCRSAYRYDFPPTYRSARFGFRVVREK